MAIRFDTPATRDPRPTAATDRRIDGYRGAFDLLVSAILAIVTLPIVLVAAVGSAIALREWPFFCHERVGLDGGSFCCVKVRTLPSTVPGYIDKYELSNHEIPAFCQFLRRRHLDELPQLYLVVLGQMSLVGPRPEMMYLHEQMEPAFGLLRTSVRPGCTGLWQVSQDCTEMITDAPEYDRFYIENRSLRLDLWIALRTVAVMAGLGNTVGLSDVPPWALRRTPGEVIDLRPVIDLRDNATAERSVQLPATASR